MNDMQPYETFLNEQFQDNSDFKVIISCAKQARAQNNTSQKAVFNFACSFAAPILCNYVLWFLDNAIKQNIKTLYFDNDYSFILKNIADIIIKERQYELETKALSLSASILDENNSIQEKELLQKYLKGIFAQISCPSDSSLADEENTSTQHSSCAFVSYFIEKKTEQVINVLKDFDDRKIAFYAYDDLYTNTQELDVKIDFFLTGIIAKYWIKLICWPRNEQTICYEENKSESLIKAIDAPLDDNLVIKNLDIYIDGINAYAILFAKTKQSFEFYQNSLSFYSTYSDFFCKNVDKETADVISKVPNLKESNAELKIHRVGYFPLLRYCLFFITGFFPIYCFFSNVVAATSSPLKRKFVLFFRQYPKFSIFLLKKFNLNIGNCHHVLMAKLRLKTLDVLRLRKANKYSSYSEFIDDLQNHKRLKLASWITDYETIFRYYKSLFKGEARFFDECNKTYDYDIGIFWGKRLDFKDNIYLLKEVLYRNKDFVFAELGFINRLGVPSLESIAAGQSLSFNFDRNTPYFDAIHKSQLEDLLNDKNLIISDEQKLRARKCINIIVKNHLTKYNHQPIFTPCIGRPNKEKILVVDQVFGDMSIKCGMANKSTFKRMLDAAISENPDADIIIKTHPDTILGAGGHYQTMKSHDNIFVERNAINPISLISYVDKVYVCTSQFGFEALMCGKDVTIFGMPFYAGWGLAHERVKLDRRTNTRSLEEVFYIAYIMYTHYVDPIKNCPCEIEIVMDYIIKNRDKYIQN